MGKDRFDLEQEILDCWGICEDIDTLLEGVLEKDISRDDVANVLLGIKGLYELKFDKLFATFEHLVHTRAC